MDDENEPYTRWQGLRIAQLGLCIALFLSFSIAALGFSVNLLVQPRFDITVCFAKLSFLCSVIFGLASVFFGSIAFLTRLWDFRTTAKVVRHRQNPHMADEIERWRRCYKLLGKWSWRLFTWQLCTFGLQILGLAIAFGITYGKRLV